MKEDGSITIPAVHLEIDESKMLIFTDCIFAENGDTYMWAYVKVVSDYSVPGKKGAPVSEKGHMLFGKRTHAFFNLN